MRWIRKLFGSDSESAQSSRRRAGRHLAPEEAEKIGTEKDLLVGYEAADRKLPGFEARAAR